MIKKKICVFVKESNRDVIVNFFYLFILFFNELHTID
jgi:hypothetical protein